MKLFRILVIFTSCIGSFAYAEWDPSCLSQEFAHLLNQRKYINLKKIIISELKNSWCSVEKINLLMDLILLTQPEICVEIGAFTGSSILPIASTLKYINSGEIFAIDAWSNAEATKYLTDNDPNKLWWSQLDMKLIHDSYRFLMNKWSLGGYYTEIFKPSTEAIHDVPGEIDFLHLDGDYSEIGSLQDVELYLPKVKSGGYILLSNFYTIIHREQPKNKSFVLICDTCDIVTSIENNNAVLFRKN